MVTLKHPAFPELTRDVEAEDVTRWVASGWIDEREAPEPRAADAVILPVDPPKPGPRRKPKNPSIGDD